MLQRPLQSVGRRAISLERCTRVQRAWNSSAAISPKFSEPEWATREEPVAEYATERGYIEISVGQDLGGYTVLRKLGWGTGSTVWLAQRKSDWVYAALKATKGIEQDPTDSPRRQELAFLQRTRTQPPSHPGHARISHLYDAFAHPHSRAGHQCLATEPLSQHLALLAEHRCRDRPASCATSCARCSRRSIFGTESATSCTRT
ncbi:hypothetical protein PsYK624_058060 [Phanerochaete sordida]|uniref:non-specific serine/threonine protein kinase n=1 Tax=Phanerochaete sordida TaxID=48140 RepID=A0A9P3G936_9APHY|nr:hypothetical protein PsYK624_058060 [Phanerochaete sordida]